LSRKPKKGTTESENVPQNTKKRKEDEDDKGAKKGEGR